MNKEIEQPMNIQNVARTNMDYRELREAVGVCVGMASMCWSVTPQGVFDSESAINAMNEIMRAVDRYTKPLHLEIYNLKAEIHRLNSLPIEMNAKADE